MDFEKAFDTPPHERLKSKLFRTIWNWWNNVEMDRLFLLLQKTASCKRSEGKLASRSVSNRTPFLVLCNFLLCVVFSCVFITPIWCPGSGVVHVLDGIDSWPLPS